MSASQNIDQVSGILGQHLIAGWTMSAEACPNPDCVGCPIMFKGDESFCARCDKLPRMAQHSSRKSQSGIVPSESTIQGRTSPVSDDSDAYALASVSTPETPSSQRQDPVNQLNAAFQQDLQTAAPQPSQAELDRRAQSDRASHEISAKMLQGWSLLAQECPNPTCHGIPLMKPPKARPEGAPTASVTADPSALAAGLPESGRVRSASKRNKFSQHNHQQGAAAAAAAAAPLSDPRMLCVACGGRYLKESDAPAYDAWAASQEQQQQQTQRGSSSTGQGGAAASVAPSVSHSNKRAQEHIDMGRMKSDNAAAEPAAKRRASVGERAQPSIPAPTMTVPASSNDEMRSVQDSIEHALKNMSAHLTELSTPKLGQALPVAEMTQTAQAISSLAQSLKDVRQL